MDWLINSYVSASGIWKKVASILPLVIGVGSLLSGLGGLCLEFGHAANASAMLDLLKHLQTDPNVGLIVAGLGALGVHQNHTSNVSNLQEHADKIEQIAPTLK